MTSRQRKRQTRLQLTPLPSSSPAKAVYHQQIADRAAAVGLEASPWASGNKRRKVSDALGESRSSVSRAPRHTNGSDVVALEESDSDISETIRPPSRRSKSARKASSTTGISKSSPLLQSGKSPLPTPDSGAFSGRRSKPERVTRSGAKQDQSRVVLEHDKENGEDAKSSRKASDNFIDLGTDSEDDSDGPITPARKRARVATPTDDEDDLPDVTHRSRRVKSQSNSGAGARSSDSEEEQLPTSSTSRRRLIRPRTSAVIDVEEDISDESKQDGDDTQAEHDKGTQNHHALTEEERQELEEDLHDLKSSSSESEPRTHKSNKLSDRAAAIQKLKKRRAAASAPQVINLDDDNSDVQEVDEPSDSDLLEEDGGADLPQGTAAELFEEREDDNDFIEDEDGPIGAPEEALPLAFTRYAALPAHELFEWVVEWMVQKKLNPGFNDSDEIYRLAFNKLEDEVKGLAGSKFESSAWKPEFIHALRARPELGINHMDRNDPDLMFQDRCDACNKSGHNPTFEIQFKGRPYNKLTLEEVERDDDEDESNDEDDDDAASEEAEARDALGNIIVSETHIFYVGKFCAANAEKAHALQHWKIHLYEWTVEWLRDKGHLTDEKVVQRDKWGEPKRRRYANKVFDEMQTRGKVKTLYEDYREEIDRARAAKRPLWDRDAFDSD